MGFFAHLYLVEAAADDAGVEVVTSVFRADVWPQAFLSWMPGERPTGLYEYADGTLFSDTQLRMLSSFPVRRRCDTEIGADENHCLIEASFTPPNSNDAVLFHFLLPRGFVPRRDLEPLVQPCAPLVCTAEDRIVATYPVIGAAKIQFWVARLGARESLRDYDLKRVLHPDEQRGMKVGMELNFGIIKFKVAER